VLHRKASQPLPWDRAKTKMGKEKSCCGGGISKKNTINRHRIRSQKKGKDQRKIRDRKKQSGKFMMMDGAMATRVMIPGNNRKKVSAQGGKIRLAGVGGCLSLEKKIYVGKARKRIHQGGGFVGGGGGGVVSSFKLLWTGGSTLLTKARGRGLPREKIEVPYST